MIRKGYVDIADGQMHYRFTEGGEGPPLVFFHMTAASSEAYEPLMRLLDGRVPTFAFDSPNYGESFRTDRSPTVEYMAECMLDALTAMGIEKFHTFGHHTGVSIQCEMAVQAPDRVLSTVINGPTYSTPAEMEMFKGALAWKNPPDVKGAHVMKAWGRIRNNSNLGYFDESPEFAEIMTRDMVDMLRAGTNWCWGYEAVFTHDLPDRMKRQSAPMMLICGGEDQSYALHQAATKDFPDAPVFENPVGGVYYVETHPQDFVDPILNFIKDINSKA
jgi:pimeloyl-ACP methyl ester carboxylesterase